MTFSPSSTLEMQEIAIALSISDLSPSSFNLDFLKMSGIVPKDWELAQQPVLNNNFSQISFTNGLNLLAQPRLLTFLEPLKSQSPPELYAYQTATQYLEKLPHADYQGIGINPKILIGFPQQKGAAQQFITQRLLSPGDWQKVGEDPLQASLSLSYKLKRCPLNLTINEVTLQHAQYGAVDALLFTGGFSYGVPEDVAQSGKIANHFQKMIDNWRTDLALFQELIHQKFLAQKTNIFPNQIL